MNTLKKISNLLFGTKYHTEIEPYHAPSKKKLVANMFRHYGAEL